MDVQDGLPPCHGPKLHPSALANASITWKDMLDDYSEPYSGHSEIMAHVFKVEIESKHYALKVFMPYDISYDYHQFYTAGDYCRIKLQFHATAISAWRKKTSENWRMSGTLISVLNRTTP
ncbi:kinetochore sim4 complex subunit FTA2 domain-containing protein [Hirsutella rhossiliensis]